MYESKISNSQWIACDIPGNVGWIAFLTGLVLCLIRQLAMLKHHIIFTLLLLDVLCGAAMIVGIAELVSERIARLDRVLPKRRLYRGFGALTFGGLFGAVFSLPALAIAAAKGLEGTAFLCLLCGGGLLCFVFAGLILKEYQKIDG